MHPIQPYLGLRPYTEKDQDNFFGRVPEKRIIVDKILANKLTLLFAASGVGKSSLLQAAVIPELKTGENLDVVYHRDWFDDPAMNLKQTVVDYLKQPGKVSDDELPNNALPLNTFFQAGTQLTSQPLVIILDQFEEFFNYQRYRKAFKPFIKQLAAAILDSQTATTFVISMREDFALELNAFQPDLPMLLFNNFYRLEKLTKDMAKQAIVNPLKPYGFHYETGLLETLLDDLSRREQIEPINWQATDFWDAPIEPPHLQIVCTLLWEKDANNPAKQITNATYQNSGQAIGLLRNYLDSRIQALSADDKKLASLAFNYLVSKYGTKMAYPVGELAQLLNVDVQALTHTLNQLEQARILRKQLRQQQLWYELYHDIFAKGVYEWNEVYKDQQNYYLRLHANHEIADDIELYQGIRQPRYLYETGYSRANIEPGKWFTQKRVSKVDELNLELIGLLPLAERIRPYYDDGEIMKALKLANASISAYDRPLSKRVFNTLSEFRSVENFHALQGRLQSEHHVGLKKQLMTTLTKIQAPFPMTNVFLPFLQDENSDICLDTIKILAKSDEMAAVKPLIELLEHSDSYVRITVAEELAQLGVYEEVVKPLLELFKHSDFDIRCRAVSELARLRMPEATKFLTQLLKDNNLHIPNVLPQLETHEAIKLTQWLKNNNSLVYSFTIEKLAKLGRYEEVVKPLIELLKHSDFNIRYQAAIGLVELEMREAVEPLIELLKGGFEFNTCDIRYYGYLAGQLAPLGVRAVEPLIELLEKSGNYFYGRHNIAFMLAQLRVCEAIEPLIKLLKDNDYDIRIQAINGLVQLRTPEAVKPFIELLKDNNYDICISAAKGLAQLGAREVAVKHLSKLLKDRDSQVRIRAANGLAQLNAHEAVEPLIELFKDRDSNIRNRAADGLVQLGAHEAIKPLIELLNHQDSYVRCSVANGLVQLGAGEATVKPLIDLLKNNNPGIRSNAANQLAQLGTREAVNPLIELLKDSNRHVVHHAVDGLVQLRAYEAVKPLIELLKNSDCDVCHIVDGLAQLKARKTVKPFIKLLKDSSVHVRSSAIKGLAQLGTPEAIKPLIELVKDSYFEVRNNAIEGLAKLGACEAVKPLIKLLKNHDPDVCYHAAKGLVQLEMREVPHLIKLLKIDDIDIRSDVAVELAQLGIREAVEPLIELLKDSDSYTRTRAAEGLAQWGGREGVKPLIELLKDNNSSVRDRAAEGLAQLGAGEAAIKPLLELLKDIDEDVRWTAIATLTQLGMNHQAFSPVWAETIQELQENSRHFSADKRKETAEKLGQLLSTQSIVLLTPLLEDWHLPVKKQAINSLEKLGNKWLESGGYLKTQRFTHPMKPALLTTSEPLESVRQIISALSALWTDANINIRQQVITAISKLVVQIPEEKTRWLEKFAQLAKDQQEFSSLRVIALNTLITFGTDEATETIINLLQSTPAEMSSLELAAVHALGKIHNKAALECLRQQLANLTERKQAWRHQRDLGQQLEPWQYSQWETELGYAIAQLAPETTGIELLAHNMAEVRKGAWLAISEIGQSTLIKTLVEKHQHSPPEAAHFRHALFQAIDGILITLEVKGNQQDLTVLQTLLPFIELVGIKDRVEWTVLSLEKKWPEVEHKE